MERKVYWVTHRPGQEDWALVKPGSNRPLFTSDNKQDVVDKGREVARNQELGQLVVQSKFGQIQYEHTYGQDPRKYPS